MFFELKELTDFKLCALDGDIGRVKDFYFEDQHWTVRYIVADTGTWLASKLVLLSPFGLKRVNEHAGLIETGLTRQQIENSPAIDAAKPVSRQFEEEYYRYYGWPLYWNGPTLWGPSPYPTRYDAGYFDATRSSLERPEGEPHLRSIDEVSRYHIQARDGELGHVDDFILDDDDWAIRYLLVDTRHWLSGKKILVSPQWIEAIDWAESTIRIDLLRDTIRNAPQRDESTSITREFEAKLYEYYQREAYWTHPVELSPH